MDTPCLQRIAALIHHTRNQMTALLALPELAARPQACEALQGMAADLTSVMALLRAGNAAVPLQRHEVILPDWFAGLVTEVQGLCRRSAPALTLHVESGFSQALFPVWTLDGQLVRLAVLDAVMNACRHARSCIALTASCTPTALILTVADDGPGFPAGWLEKMRQDEPGGQKGKGLRHPAPASPSPHGTGMGLMLARQIALAHQEGGRQGRLTLANGPDEDCRYPGAIFRLILP